MTWKFKRSRGYVIAVIAAAGSGFGVALAFASLQAGATATVPAGITGGQTLTNGSTLQSPDGHYQAIFSAGVLSTKITGGRTLWKTGTSQSGAYAVLQPNGMLVIFGATGQVLWDSQATGSGCPALGMQLDGNLVDDDTSSIWASGSTVHGLASGDVLEPGWTLYSDSGEDYRLTMQTNGNLVLANSSAKTIWQSNTQGNPGAHAFMNPDGGFVVVSPSGTRLWGSGTAGNDGATMVLTSAGNIDVVSTNANVLWRSDSSGQAGTGSGYDTKVIAAVGTPCPATVTPPTSTVTQTVTQTQTVTTTQTVLVPTTTVLTVATPTPRRRLRTFDVKVITNWYYKGSQTFLHAIAIGRLPKGVVVHVTYDPREKGHRATVRKAVNAGSVAKLIKYMRALVYRPGQTLNLDLTRTGYQNEWATFTFRYGKLPSMRPASKRP